MENRLYPEIVNRLIADPNQLRTTRKARLKKAQKSVEGIGKLLSVLEGPQLERRETQSGELNINSGFIFETVLIEKGRGKQLSKVRESE